MKDKLILSTTPELEKIAENIIQQIEGASWNHIINARKETRQEYDGGLSYDYWIRKAMLVQEGKLTIEYIVKQHN